MAQSERLSQAVILAGGFGTRLGDLTSHTPKPLVSVNGRPFMEYQLRLLSRHGVTEAIILTGHLGEQIESIFGTGEALGLMLQYSREPQPLGTGGALALAERLLKPAFFLVNGDTYLDMDYQAAARGFANLRAPGPSGLMVVWDAECAADVGNVKLDPTSTRVTSYSKGKGGDHLYIDAGVLILTKSVLDFIPKGRYAGLEEYVFPRLAEEGRLLAFESPTRFYDIGTRERLALFERSIS